MSSDRAERRIYNPAQRDYVTFVETALETHGARTVVDVELAPGGGVNLHYHKRYAERFECTEGVLKVQLGRETRTLQPGESTTADIYVNHRFFNDSDRTCRCRVTIVPGSRGFEEGLQVAYGLARDGKCNAKGIPRDPRALAWFVSHSETNLPGWLTVIEFILNALARRAVSAGLDQVWRDKYVRF